MVGGLGGPCCGVLWGALVVGGSAPGSAACAFMPHVRVEVALRCAACRAGISGFGGGAVLSQLSQEVWRNVRLTGNYAGSFGGGINLFSSDFTIVDSRVDQARPVACTGAAHRCEVGQEGKGCREAPASVALPQPPCVPLFPAAQNTAGLFGGALEALYSKLRAVNTTFVGNTANFGVPLHAGLLPAESCIWPLQPPSTLRSGRTACRRGGIRVSLRGLHAAQVQNPGQCGCPGCRLRYRQGRVRGGGQLHVIGRHSEEWGLPRLPWRWRLHVGGHALSDAWQCVRE